VIISDLRRVGMVAIAGTCNVTVEYLDSHGGTLASATVNVSTAVRLRDVAVPPVAAAAVLIALNSGEGVAFNFGASPTEQGWVTAPGASAAIRLTRIGGRVCFGPYVDGVAVDAAASLAEGEFSISGIQPGIAADELGKAVDSPAGVADVGVAMLRVRKDDPTVAETPIAGDYVLAKSSRNGRDWVSNPLIADAALVMHSTQGVAPADSHNGTDAVLNGYACGDLVVSFGGGSPTPLTTLTITIIPFVNGVAAEGSAIVVVLSSVSSSTPARVFRVEGGRTYRCRLGGAGSGSCTVTANMVPIR
jgi:hypothetical protein